MKWKQIFLIYIVGVGIIFSVFYLMSLSSQPFYRSSFKLDASLNPVHVNFAISDLFQLKSLDNKSLLSQKLNMDSEDLNRIYTAEHDVLVGGVIKIDVTAKDTEVIPIFQQALIRYLNSDSNLNLENSYRKSKLEIEMALINKQLSTLNNKTTSSASQWQYTTTTSDFDPIISSDNSLTQIYLQSRLNKLAIEHFKLQSVQPLNEPVIPLMIEQANKFSYFIFSNIIVLSIIFVQFLVFSNNRTELE